MVRFQKKIIFSRGFVNELVSAKKVGICDFHFHEKLDNVKKVGILRQRACDGKGKNTWVFFRKKYTRSRYVFSMFSVVAKHFITEKRWEFRANQPEQKSEILKVLQNSVFNFRNLVKIRIAESHH
jgi:hypothetical protein